MNRKTIKAAACLAAIVVWGHPAPVRADEIRELPAPWPGRIADKVAYGGAIDSDAPIGEWNFGPVAGLHASRGDFDEGLVATLGVRGVAKVDSRLGAIYSRLSLSFEHEFRADEHQVVGGLSGAGPHGFYSDRSEVDVVTADAAFALRMSESTFGFVEYGAEMDPGGSAEHQVTLRLRFDF